ncbi:protein of unknown function [Caballeronia sp. S22]
MRETSHRRAKSACVSSMIDFSNGRFSARLLPKFQNFVGADVTGRAMPVLQEGRFQDPSNPGRGG